MKNIEELIRDIISTIEMTEVTTNNYPTYIESKIQLAVQEKRLGNYYKSIKLYKEIFQEEKIAYTGVINGLFKSIAAAGYIKEAVILLKIGNDAMKKSSTVFNPFSLPNGFEDHLGRISQVISNEKELINYLKSISGNVNYIMERNYNEIRKDFFNL